MGYIVRLKRIVKTKIASKLLDVFVKAYGLPLELGQNKVFMEGFGTSTSGAGNVKLQKQWIKEYDKIRNPETFVSTKIGSAKVRTINKYYPELKTFLRMMKVKVISTSSIRFIRFILLRQEEEIPPVMIYQSMAAVLQKGVSKKSANMWNKVIGARYRYVLFVPDNWPYLLFRDKYLHEIGHLIDKVRGITTIENYNFEKEYRGNLHRTQISDEESKKLSFWIKENMQLILGKKGPSETFANDFARRPTTLLNKHYPQLLVYRKR